MKIKRILVFVLLLITSIGFTQTKLKKSKVYTVEIVNMKFVPANLTVEKGDKVVWINKDFLVHDVTDELNNSWHSKPLKQGDSFSKIITKNESYYCSLHKVMKGNIHVKN